MNNCKCNLCGGSMVKTWNKSRFTHSLASLIALGVCVVALFINWLIAMVLFLIFCLGLKSPKQILACRSCGQVLPCITRPSASGQLAGVVGVLALTGALGWVGWWIYFAP
jgi:hypothetical protein